MSELFKPEVVFLCPFCGAKCAASAEGENAGVLHAMPQCPRFEKSDPIQFLAACNAEFVKTAPS